MREIKFRVWDNIAKKYIDSRYVSISGLGLLHVAKRIIKTCFRPLHTRKNPWFIVEQYTGLKDKNSTEIYEGDIVKYGDSVGEVFYDSEGACFNVSGFYNKSQDYPTMAFSEYGNDIMEVIGNIHENPELVEEKHENL